MSLRVGLTGGLATGKTTVAEMLASRGAYVMYADKVGHEVMAPGQAAYREIVQSFGDSILKVDGAIDRAKLAEMAFGSGRIDELNRIVHPAVRDRMQQWMQETAEFDPRAILVFEAALILEGGLGKYFDKLVVVSSQAQQKLDRFAGRTLGTDTQSQADAEQRTRALREAERRIGVQLSQEEKIAAADYVIDNSGSLAETERQVNQLYKSLQQLSTLRQRASSP